MPRLQHSTAMAAQYVDRVLFAIRLACDEVTDLTERPEALKPPSTCSILAAPPKTSCDVTYPALRGLLRQLRFTNKDDTRKRLLERGGFCAPTIKMLPDKSCHRQLQDPCPRRPEGEWPANNNTAGQRRHGRPGNDGLQALSLPARYAGELTCDASKAGAMGLQQFEFRQTKRTVSRFASSL